MNKPKLNEEVIVVISSLGNYRRRYPMSGSNKDQYITGVVTKVGRKYFSVTFNGDVWEFDMTELIGRKLDQHPSRDSNSGLSVLTEDASIFKKKLKLKGKVDFIKEHVGEVVDEDKIDLILGLINPPVEDMVSGNLWRCAVEAFVVLQDYTISTSSEYADGSYVEIYRGEVVEIGGREEVTEGSVFFIHNDRKHFAREEEFLRCFVPIKEE